MGAHELALHKKGSSLCQGYTNTFFLQASCCGVWTNLNMKLYVTEDLYY